MVWNLYHESVKKIINLHQIAGPECRYEIMNLPLLPIDGTTLLAIAVVSLLVVVLLVMRNYHSRLRTKETILAQSTVSKEESPAVTN